MNKSSEWCYGNTPMYLQDIDLIERVQRVMTSNNRRFFMYAFLAELSHSDSNELQRADDMIHAWLNRSHEENRFNHTVLMILGDHGRRFGGIRSTLIGQIEERMPIVTIRFPPSFYKKYPHIEKALDKNQMRLSTFYDLHGTLEDILQANYKASGQREPWDSRHLSLLYPIPANRTCRMASIPQHYCVCTQSRPLNIDDPMVMESANFLLKHVNNLLSVEGDKCAKLKLAKIMRAEEVEVDQRVVQGVRMEDDGYMEDAEEYNKKTKTRKEGDLKMIRIVVRAEPSNALLEATVQKGFNFSIQNEVCRINKYGNTSYCIERETNRRYCFCKGAKPITEVHAPCPTPTSPMQQAVATIFDRRTSVSETTNAE